MHILPICKSYVLKIPGFPESYFDWKKDLLGYIIKNRIENKEDVDAYTIEKEVCPGQTVLSIKQFVCDLKNETTLFSHEIKINLILNDSLDFLI